MSGNPDQLPQLWNWDYFEIGQLIGCKRLVLCDGILEQWSAIYGPVHDQEHLPMGAVPFLLMRAYAAIVTPRPPGNLHVGQSCTLRELPRMDTELQASAACIHKEIRGERRVVKFEVKICEARSNEPLISGISTMFWAA